MEIGALEDGLFEWVHIGLIDTYEFMWVPHEVISHACIFDPTIDMFWYYVLKLKLEAI